MKLPEIDGKVIVNGYEHRMLIVEYKRIKAELQVYSDDNGELKVCYDEMNAMIASLEKALYKIIEMNRQTALHQYGDPEKAELWACVKVARNAVRGIV